MNIPNLITMNKEKEIEDFVFVDLQLNQVFSCADIAFLKWPCKEQEIKNRQEIFRSMKNETFYFALKQAINTIDDYVKEKERLQLSPTELEKHYRRYNLLTRYVAICESMSQLKGYCQAADAVADYFLCEEMNRKQKHLKENIVEMKAILSNISKCTFTFANEDSIQKGHTASSYINKISRCAKAMNFETLPQRSTPISLDNTLSDVISQLYHHQIVELNTIEARYKEQLQSDFYDIKAQIRFFINIWDVVQKAAVRGIPYTFPKISKTKEIRMNSAYGISLLSKTTGNIVPNAIHFNQTNPFYFVTGANGGGKTEYLRNLGANLLLFLAGCPIFSESAWIYPFHYVATHFPKDERYEKAGRLEEEQIRVTRMLKQADSESVYLFNETFSGTKEQTGVSLLTEVAQTLQENKIFGLAVTHFSGIDTKKYAVLCPEVIDTPNGEHKRTYRIKRKTNPVESHANDIIRKYKLDQPSLRKRKAL